MNKGALQSIGNGLRTAQKAHVMCKEGAKMFQQSLNTISKDKAWHIAYGRHSLIPECCIQFWVKEWLDAPYKLFSVPVHYNYVPCLNCLKKNRLVKIKDCDTACFGPGICSRIFRRAYGIA